MKHNVCHMSTCTESACIYALFKITDSFFTLLWTNVSNHMLVFNLELKNHAWFVGKYLGFHKPPQEITRGAIPYCYARISIILEIFCGVMQMFHMTCGRCSILLKPEAVNLQFFQVWPQLSKCHVLVLFSINSNCSSLITFIEK